MELCSLDVRNDVAQQVRDRFRKAAASTRGLFSYPTGRQGLLALHYPEQALNNLPQAVQEGFCGVGNPFAAGLPDAGQQVLDVGCGAGVDALVAAMLVGPRGSVTGLEFTPEMRERAEANAAECGLANVAFVSGGAEALAFADASFDRVLSNGVFNLVMNKRQALAETFRVLRPGGRLQVADQILEDASSPGLGQPQAQGWAA